AAGLVRVHLLVADSGIGIPADKRDRLFKPFSQVDATTTRHYGGTGLGLAITQRLPPPMRGGLPPGDRPGARPPRAGPPEAPRGAGSDAPRERAAEPLRVLVVEDDAVAREAVAALVADLGATPSQAAATPEALAALREAAREGRPLHAVIVDGGLPRDDAL